MPAARRSPTAYVRAVALAVVLLAATACGSADVDARPSGATWQPPTGSPPAVPAGAAVTDCEGSGEAVAAALGDASTVTGVEVMGQCTHVSVRTTLGYDKQGALAADRLCETAAEAAYETELSSVTVKAADGSELANGVEGMGCLTPWG